MSETTLKLIWVPKDKTTLRGYLMGQPETTLFLLPSAETVGKGQLVTKVHLTGVFVPDETENLRQTFEVAEAKEKAAEYLMKWVGRVAKMVASSESASTFRMHILGPDDVVRQPDELTALREANAMNIHIAREHLKHANDPHWPWSMAVVERDGVSYREAVPNAECGTRSAELAREDSRPTPTDPNLRAKNPKEGDLFITPGPFKHGYVRVQSVSDGVVRFQQASRFSSLLADAEIRIDDWPKAVDLTLATGVRFIPVEEIEGCTSDFPRPFKSCVIWPASAGVSENYSEDNHPTKGAAVAVGDFLKREGLGGDRKFFPVVTWIQPEESTNQKVESGKGGKLVDDLKHAGEPPALRAKNIQH